METKQENKYFDLIEKCNTELDIIVNKVDMIKISSLKGIAGTNCEDSTETPSFTELERRLNYLYFRIKTLTDDIVI